MKCPKCQFENTDTARFCSNCATLLEAIQKPAPAEIKTGKTGPDDLAPGTMVGREYEIIEKLGRGGMGEVYRALDRGLGRQVAVKALPQEFSSDPERLCRFVREAKLLAALNHPNIAAVHELEESGGRRFLILEMVEGETLQTRLDRGAFGVDEALDAALQVAAGLEAAHEKGIVHRDLKPGNIMITPEGRVKILDFGLAKAQADETPGVDIAHSPTITADMTLPGVILGTAAYMSPEQAKGKAVDRRADIWAFGCILYECLTGRHAFPGDTIAEVLAGVLKSEPDWTALPPDTPPAVRRLLRRCLAKERAQRLGDIHDAVLEIADSGSEAAAAPPAGTGRRLFSRSFILGTAVACVGLTVIGAVLFHKIFRGTAPVETPPVMRFAIPDAFSSRRPIYPALDISADGRRVITVGDRDGQSRLYLRTLDRLDPSPLDGTENAEGPFFSPDGQRIGFFAEGKLKTVAVTGGAPAVVCEVPRGLCGSWGTDGTIVYTPHWGYGLLSVPAAGGTPGTLTTPNAAKGEISHLWPQVLPGGRAVLFTDMPGDVTLADDSQVAVQVKGEAEPRILIRGGSYGRYVASGHLIYLRRGALLAVPFDLKTLEVRGAPLTVLDDIQSTDWTGVAHFAVSETGTLAYAVGRAYKPEDSLVRVNLKGVARPLLPERYVFTPAFSPDGRIAVRIAAANDDIWIFDPGREQLTRFTLGFGDELNPAWTPNGRSIIYSQGRTNFFWKSVDGSGEPESLLPGENPRTPGSVSPDGGVLAFSEIDPQTRGDIWLLPLNGERQPRRLLATSFNETSPKFSPDGRWIAYVSDESGRGEVYLQRAQAAGGKRQISTSGGSQPVWSHAGNRLFFLDGKKLIAVEVDPTTGAPGSIKPLFELPNLVPESGYDVAPDDRSFAMVVKNGLPPATELRVVLNWFEELKRLVPAGKK